MFVLVSELRSHQRVLSKGLTWYDSSFKIIALIGYVWVRVEVGRPFETL